MDKILDPSSDTFFQILTDISKVPSQLSLLKFEQPQPSFVREMLQSFNPLHRPPLDLPQGLLGLLVLSSPELDIPDAALLRLGRKAGSPHLEVILLEKR